MEGSQNGSHNNFDTSFDTRPVVEVVLQAFVMGIIILCAVVGNMLILLAIYFDKTLQTITNAFVVNLACADLALSVIGMPFTMASSITYHWIFGKAWCNVNGMANSLFCITSILTLAAVSVDRYIAILFPLRYPSWMTRTTAIVTILYIWFHALIFAVLPVFAWSKYTFIVSESICTVNWPYNAAFTIFLFAVCFFIPLGVLLFTYFSIYRTARRHARRITPRPGKISLGSTNSHIVSSDITEEWYIGNHSVSFNNSNSIKKQESEGGFNNAMNCMSAQPPKTMPSSSENGSLHNKHGQPSCECKTPTSLISRVNKTGIEIENNRKFPVEGTVSGFHDNTKKGAKIKLVQIASSPMENLRLRTLKDSSQNTNIFSLDKGQITNDTTFSLEASIHTDRNKSLNDNSLAGCPPIPPETELKSKTSNEDGSTNGDTGHKQIHPPNSILKVRNSINVFSESSIQFMNKQKNKIEKTNNRRMHRDTKAAKTLLIVVGTFIVCWTPHFVGIFCLLKPGCRWPDRFFAVTTWLAMLNSACNPIIYGVMSRQFRRRFKQILQCKRVFNINL